MVHACSGVRASKISTHYCLSNTHVCMTTSAAAAAAMATWSLPSPCVPPHQTFFSNSNFCLRKKKLRPTKHTLPFVQKKEPSQVFLATHTAHIKAVPCCWNGTSIDNAIHTLQTQNRFLYNIVLDLYCFGHGHSAARRPVCGLLGNEKYIPCMWLWNFRPHHKKSRSGHYSSMAKWNADHLSGGSVLCLVRTETLVSTPGKNTEKNITT